MSAVGGSTEHKKTLAWLDHALTQARDIGQVRLENILEAVRAEVVFEMRLAASMLDGKAPANTENDEKRRAD